MSPDSEGLHKNFPSNKESILRKLMSDKILAFQEIIKRAKKIPSAMKPGGNFLPYDITLTHRVPNEPPRFLLLGL